MEKPDEKPYTIIKVKTEQDFKTLHNKLDTYDKFKQIETNRMSHWDKLLKEDPREVPNALRSELVLILKLFKVDIPSLKDNEGNCK